MSRIVVGRLGGSFYTVPESVLDTSVLVTGGVRSGKTSLVSEMVRSISMTPRPFLMLDGAGTLFENTKLAVANQVLRFHRKKRKRDGDAHLARHAFVKLGQPTPLGVNLLRRVPLPGGNLETYQQVAGRVLSAFNAHFEDFHLRVTFQQRFESTIILLCAAGRPMKEAMDLYDDTSGAYAKKLLELQGEEAHEPTVALSWRTFNKTPTVPTLRANEIGSFEHSVYKFLAGPFADFFSRDSFKLEDLCFGDKRLCVTAKGLGHEGLGDFGYRLLHTSVFTLIEHRDPALFPVVGTTLVDELSWFKHGDIQGMEDLGNKRWSIVLIFQHRTGNFDLAGMNGEAIATLTDDTAPTKFIFRPSDPKVAEWLTYKMGPLRSDGKFIEKELVAVAETEGESEDEGESDGDSWQQSEHASRGKNTSSGWSDDPGNPGGYSCSYDAEGEYTGYSERDPAAGGRRYSEQNGLAEGHATGSATGGSHQTSRRRGTNKSRTVTTSTQAFRVGIAEQREELKGEILAMDRHMLFVVEHEKAEIVEGLPERKFPRTTVRGVDYVAAYEGHHDRLWQRAVVPISSMPAPVLSERPAKQSPSKAKGIRPPDLASTAKKRQS